MTTTADTPSSQTSPEATKALNLLRSLPAADLKVIRAKLKPEQKFPIPRTPAGGIAESLELDDMFEAFMERNQDDWVSIPGRYYFSKIGNCFYKEWCKENNLPCDHGTDPNTCLTCRFDAGKSEPGHAVEEYLQFMMEQVYVKGKPGSVLKDMRISDAVEVECEDAKGKLVKETIHIVGKTDMLVMGDNFEILEFEELKTPIYWPKVKNAFMKAHGKVAPLFLAGVEEPQRSDGIVNLGNALQLAVGVHILRKNGLKVRKVSLIYMSRERYRDYVKIIFSEKEVEYLYDLAVWWMTEHHANVRSGKPPLPQFMMGWECDYCPFNARCSARNKKDGLKREIHPIVVGLDKRLQEANGAQDEPSDNEQGLMRAEANGFDKSSHGQD